MGLTCSWSFWDHSKPWVDRQPHERLGQRLLYHLLPHFNFPSLVEAKDYPTHRRDSTSCFPERLVYLD